MSNVPDKSRRQRYLPQSERQVWRHRLFQHIRLQRRYRNQVVQDLRPLWKAAVAESGPELDAAGQPIYRRRFFGLHRRAAHDPSRVALMAYVDAVELMAMRSLRITPSKAASLWPCEFIHVDVEPRAALSGGEWDGMPQWSRVVSPDVPEGTAPWNVISESMSIHVSPSWGMVRLGSPMHPELSLDEHKVEAQEQDRFVEWDQLRESAYSIVDRIIEEFQRYYSDQYPQQNPSTRARLEQATEDFAAYLMSGEQPLDRAAQERLANFAKLVGADYSRSQRK